MFGASSHSTAWIRRPGRDRILAARRAPKQAISREARRRFGALAIVLVAASILSPLVAAFSPQRIFTVASGSMEPTIPKGSLVWTSEQEPEIGDVIVYKAPVGGYQVHRIVDLVNIYGLVQFVTRGDANEATDSFVVQRDWIVGVVTRDVPYVGMLWLIPLEIQALLFFVGVFFYIGISAWDARSLLNGPRFRFTFTGLVVLLFVPAVWGGTTAVFPASTQTLGKTSSPTPLEGGTMGSATIDADGTQANVSAAAPKLWKEIVLWPCQAGGACTISAPAAYTTQAASLVRVDASEYAPAPTFYFEAFFAAPSGQTISAILYDTTSAATVPASEVSTASTSATVVRSAGFTLTGAKEYQFQLKNSGAGSGGTFYQAKLVLSQDLPTATETQVRLSGASQTGSGAFTTASRAFRWNHDASAFDGVSSSYFEVVGQVSGVLAAGEYRLVDRTASTTVGTVSTTSTSATRLRAGITLTADHEYEVEFRASFGVVPTVTLHAARVGILQSSFTTSMRYVDLSPQATTTATSFTEVGYTGTYTAATEWGGRTAYFEASLAGSGAGVTASAELYDRGLASTISGSQVDVTGTTLTRSRSAAVTLSAADGTYVPRLKASSGTAEVRNAWILVPQTVGKTYDFVLQAANDVVDACTWNVTLDATGSSNLGRLSSASLALRRGLTTETQITVASGSLTQSGGSAVSVAYPEDVQVILFTNPSSAGSSAISTELRSTCSGYGIRMIQPVTFNFA